MLLYFQAGVTTKNVINVTERVEKLTNNSKLLNTKDISVTADILEKVVHMNGTSRGVISSYFCQYIQCGTCP